METRVKFLHSQTWWLTNINPSQQKKSGMSSMARNYTLCIKRKESGLLQTTCTMYGKYASKSFKIFTKGHSIHKHA